MAQAKNLTKAQESKLGELPTTSAKIRYLTEEGKSRGEVAKILGIRYQHVRNVLITPVAKPKA